MLYSVKIKSRIIEFKPKELIFVSNLWQNEFNNIPQTAFFKTIERLKNSETIVQVSKGIYCIPEKTKFGNLKTPARDVITFYLGENGKNGVEVGYNFYNLKNLSTQVSKKREFYVYKLKGQTKNISNVAMKKLSIEPNESRNRIIQVLNFLENYSKIEDLNMNGVRAYFKEIANDFNDTEFENVMYDFKCKKSTIAFYELILNYFEVQNDLGKFFSKLSKYNIPNIEEIYETTFR